jgi:hypothetical protein
MAVKHNTSENKNGPQKMEAVRYIIFQKNYCGNNTPFII